MILVTTPIKQATAKKLWHIFLPGNQIIFGHRGVDFDLADGSSGTKPREELKGDVRASCDIKNTAKPTFPVEERLCGIQMNPALQRVERGSIHDPSVTEIRFCFFHRPEAVFFLICLSPEVHHMFDAAEFHTMI